jgi:hypothetical protein
MNVENSKYKISDLSLHLFWDLNKATISWEDSGTLITERILQYGKIKDWDILTTVYTKSELAKIALRIRYLDPKSLVFISFYLQIPQQEFRCYKERFSTKGHWIY